MCAGIAALYISYAAFGASGQATSSGLAIKAVAEIRSKATQSGPETTKLLAAQRVAPGDEVIYTLEIRNTGGVTVLKPVVVYPVPTHMMYVADSATGPGAQVSYSVDGGESFDHAESLKWSDGGRVRPAKPSDYTHIRWQLKNNLKPNSVAFARFRAVVK
jgi:uncharacterized repeat protein (TIGR01451 family)